VVCGPHIWSVDSFAPAHSRSGELASILRRGTFPRRHRQCGRAVLAGAATLGAASVVSARGRRFAIPSRGPAIRRASQVQRRALAELSVDSLSSVLGSKTYAKALWVLLRKGQSPFLEPERFGGSAPLAALQGLDADGALDFALRPEAVQAMVGSEEPGDALREFDEVCSGSSGDSSLRKASSQPPATTKFMLRLQDGLSVESVLIPQSRECKRNSTTTLCVSSQVGCAQGCRFCRTASMGILRDLSADEILAQVVQGRRLAASLGLPDLKNVVLMGMGEPLANLPAVLPAVGALTDGARMAIGRQKLQLSTVAPSPDCVRALAGIRCQLTWSLHAADDALRRRLVPSARFQARELRDAFREVLLAGRGVCPDRRFMVAAVLIAGINDSPAHARKLAEFLRPLYEEVGIILVLNLIPYNDVGLPDFSRPTEETMLAFREEVNVALPSLAVHLRRTRGAAGSAACGQLATARRAVLTTA